MALPLSLPSPESVSYPSLSKAQLGEVEFQSIKRVALLIKMKFKLVMRHTRAGSGLGWGCVTIVYVSKII